MENNKKRKNPICSILWLDASYSFNNKLPNELPTHNLTTGFIISSNDKFTNIATNVEYDQKTKELVPIDGFLIPEGLIVEFKKIDYYE